MTEIKMTLEQAEKFLNNDGGCSNCPFYGIDRSNDNNCSINISEIGCDDVVLYAARLLIADARKDAVKMADIVWGERNDYDAKKIIAKYPNVKP